MHGYKFEMQRFVRKKMTYICACIVLLLTYFTINSCAENVQSISELIFGVIPDVGIEIILCVIISNIICEDFASGTIRLMLGRGGTRTKIMFQKIAISNLIMVLFVGLSIIMTICVGMTKKMKFEFNAQFYFKLILLFLIMTSIIMMFVAISLIVKKTSIAIVSGILGMGIVQIIFAFIDSSLKLDKFRLSDYWISSYYLEFGNMELGFGLCSKIIICSIFYILFFGTCCFFGVKEMDV